MGSARLACPASGTSSRDMEYHNGSWTRVTWRAATQAAQAKVAAEMDEDALREALEALRGTLRGLHEEEAALVVLGVDPLSLAGAHLTLQEWTTGDEQLDARALPRAQRAQALRARALEQRAHAVSLSRALASPFVVAPASRAARTFGPVGYHGAWVEACGALGIEASHVAMYDERAPPPMEGLADPRDDTSTRSPFYPLASPAESLSCLRGFSPSRLTFDDSGHCPWPAPPSALAPPGASIQLLACAEVFGMPLRSADAKETLQRISAWGEARLAGQRGVGESVGIGARLDLVDGEIRVAALVRNPLVALRLVCVSPVTLVGVPVQRGCTVL
mgnify:CR=1 FL=1